VLAIALILVAAAILAYRIFSATGSQRLDQSNFYDAVTERRVRTITMVPDGIGLEIRGTLNSEATYPDDRSVERFTTYVLADPNLLETLSENGVSVKAEAPRRGSVLRLLGPLVFLLIFGAVFVFFMRRMQQGGPGPSCPPRTGRSHSRTWPVWKRRSRSFRRSSSSSRSRTSFRSWAARSPRVSC
jgi:ATP-dependent Zn protease